jgi:circadian clock protein KaiB
MVKEHAFETHIPLDDVDERTSHFPNSRRIAPIFVLKLYITGNSPRTQVAIANLQRICDQDLRGEYQLEIIDVLEQPQRAEDDKILATPTLIKHLPPPLRRVIGDLSDTEKVLLGLEVRSDNALDNPPRHSS